MRSDQEYSSSRTEEVCSTPLTIGSTVFVPGSLEPGHSGTKSRKGPTRRRPYKTKRTPDTNAALPTFSQGLVVFSPESDGKGEKRKQMIIQFEKSEAAKPEMVLTEGPSKA